MYLNTVLVVMTTTRENGPDPVEARARIHRLGATSLLTTGGTRTIWPSHTRAGYDDRSHTSMEAFSAAQFVRKRMVSQRRCA